MPGPRICLCRASVNRSAAIAGSASDPDLLVMTIRIHTDSDWQDTWRILEPIFRAGETYALPLDIGEADARQFWVEAPVYTYVAVDTDGTIVGTYFIRPNQSGPGSHVCNCGYAVAEAARGAGVATAMCEHSQREAVRLGFKAMQYNFVVSTNEGAIRLWQKLGFEIVGRLPQAFDHPRLGYVDALVMFKSLT